MRKGWVVGLTFILGGLAWWALRAPLQACGPFGLEAQFQDAGIPDTTRDEALQGQLGILRPGLPLEHLVIAYRHLVGLPVLPAAWSPEEGEGSSGAEDGLKHWKEARAKLSEVPAPTVEPTRTTSTYVDYPHITQSAFAVAATTLEARIKAHGAADSAVREWVKGQDLVFQSRPEQPCLPEPVPGPAWLKGDRAYQRAAALFYANRWSEAREAFAAITQDAASPWRAWGAYLQARCWFRQASLGAEDQAMGPLRAAQAHLEGVLKDPELAEVHGPAKAYWELVRYRTEPQGLEMEALEALASAKLAPGAGATALERLVQARRWMKQGGAGARPPKSEAASHLSLWLALMQGEAIEGLDLKPLATSPRPLPWLVAALARLPAADPRLPALKAEAEKHLKEGPAGPSLYWHLLRLGAGEGRLDQLRGALKEKWPRWAENALLREGRALAKDAATWGEFLGSRVTCISGIEWEGPSNAREPELPKESAAHYGVNPRLLDEECAVQLNLWVPLARWVELSELPSLSRQLREDLAHAAWVRALRLGRWDLERRLRPGLDPALLRALDPDYSKLDPALRDFRMALVLMRHPGLSPLLPGGMGRGIWGWEAWDKAVDFGTNWWCLGPEKVPQVAAPGFLTSDDLTANRQEWERLRQTPSIRHWFGEVLLARVEAQPEDPQLPWALHRFVRITRNADCSDKALSELSRRCFRVLHTRYPKDPWTAKTPVHY